MTDTMHTDAAEKPAALGRLHTFVINLAHDTGKKGAMQQKCADANIAVTFIEAIDGKELPDEMIAEVYAKQNALNYFGRELTRGEIGTVLSHLNVCRNLIEQNIDIALILEDDVLCRFDDEDLGRMFGALPQDWECVLLGHHTKRSRDLDALASFWSRKKMSGRYSCARFAEQPLGAYAYLVNRSGARKIIANFESIDRPIDHWSDKVLNLYGIWPSLVKVDEHLSDSSNLAGDREAMRSRTYRTPFEKLKDRVRYGLTKIRLLEAYFGARNFLLQFRPLPRYELPSQNGADK